MTYEEFDTQAYGIGDIIFYKGEFYPVNEIDFDKRLFGIVNSTNGQTVFVHCKTVDFIPSNENNEI